MNLQFHLKKKEEVVADKFLTLSSEQVVKLVSSYELTVPSEEKELLQSGLLYVVIGSNEICRGLMSVEFYSPHTNT
ncbi:uncharacterized protein LOC115035138 isoform X2 [Acyrthosiphon pisum]|uniref:Uncharacterized protein n=1 Tax=Acyrthosiphon pisum TaxID=7029 RepID=A0A8R2NUQ8_ACYPI|nr:uncharacterized protein LOC115035138 isoform X2 [Acyrthosiphon pisum]XP_029348679.1 uncharacterized protein LOC115035138 isoform X2 [Acyrthosiphon pisum]